MRVAVPLSSLFLLVCAVGCPEGDAPGEGEGEGEGEGDAGEALELVEEPIAIDVDAQLAAGFALAVRSDGRAAFVHVRQGVGTVECQLFGGETVQADNYDVIVVDEQVDGTFRTRVVASAPSLADDSVDIAVDPVSDALVVAFMGGEVATGYCGASDLMVATESGDAFVISTVATDSGDATAVCRDQEDPFCDLGDVVGRFPSLTLHDDGVALSYGDVHFGFGDTDLFGADLEVGVGASATGLALRSVSVEAGAGYNSSSTLTAEGLVAIGHANIGSHNYVDPDSGLPFEINVGVYMEVEQADGTFVATEVFPDGSVSSRVAVGARDGVGIFGAFREDGTDQLVLVHSVDGGATFEQPELIERLSLTGFDPQIGFLSDDTLVVAYGHCRDVADGNPLCNPSQDGVRVAWRSRGAAAFSKATFLGDDEDNDGLAVDMAIAPDDTITTLSFNASQSQVTIHRMRKVSTP